MDRRFTSRALLATLAAAVSCLGSSYGAADDTKGTGAQKGQDQISLVDKGQSPYSIVIAADAPAPVRFAAEELQKYLAQISGVKLPVSNNIATELAICVGKGSAPNAEEDKLASDLKDRGEDGYAMCSLGKRLVLAGNSPRATLYAVYHFLEKHLGCGWCAPREDTVPQQATIRLAPFHDAVGPPAFSMRQIILFPYGDGWMATHNLPQTDWMAKNRFNWAHPAPNRSGRWGKSKSREVFVPEVEKRGLYLEVGGHTFETWLPASRYAKDHPEYYGVKEDGSPESTEGVCLSHPDVARLMAENIIKWLDENPEADAVDLWHNDAPNHCHCPKCVPKSQRGGAEAAQAAYTGTYIRFTNQVAAQVAHRHPKVLVNFLAYWQVTDCPPGAEPLADNILVGLCLFPRTSQRTMHPLETSGQKLDSHLRPQIPAWRRLAKHFYIYEYYTLSKGYPVQSMVSMIAEDVRYLRRSGADGMSSDQGMSSDPNGRNWFPLNMYAFGRLMWDPDLKTEEIIADFCRRYYGRASDPMIAYWNLLEEGLRESWRTTGPLDLRTQKRLAQITSALSLAESKVVEDRIRATAAMHSLTIPR